MLEKYYMCVWCHECQSMYTYVDLYTRDKNKSILNQHEEAKERLWDRVGEMGWSPGSPTSIGYFCPCCSAKLGLEAGPPIYVAGDRQETIRILKGA